MALVRRLVELGRAARAESGVKIRQPLSRALVAAQRWSELGEQARAQIAEELNVMSLDALADAGALVDVTVKPNFRSLGRRFGKKTPVVAEAIGAAPAAALAAAVRRGEGRVEVDGESVELLADDVIVTEVPQEGWTVASAGGESVALDLQLSEELMVLGTARDIVRSVQQLRKDSGFEVTDRIVLHWHSEDPGVAAAFEKHGETIAGEVLAVAVEVSDSPLPTRVPEPAMTIAVATT
jgi:isoleucyl-tRNA synthetase